MDKDFTLTKYKNLCESVLCSKYVPITIQEYLQKPPDSPFVTFRHDVDRKIDMALDMAQLEHSMGIKATYYFRKTPEVFKPEIIKQIESIGHEIGYHYEVLDKTKGNKENAIQLFENELEAFRKIADIKTVCMHGNPLSRWTNLDLWRKYNFKDFGIIGEPYLSIDYNKVLYLTDTGRTWSGTSSVKDFIECDTKPNEKIRSTDDLINMIRKRRYDKICISAHPNRWNNDSIEWLIELLWQNIKNMGKILIIQLRNSKDKV